ncbi:hypothetical protein [Lentibacillus salinarum]|uniref:Uncharacterized protein n=1 Tax=Lentibacillus salinarum TaxID=446820 RepID=A0ABW3ZZD3_9BACI
MKKVENLFRGLSMENIEGYNVLTDKQKELFDQTYKAHVFMMDPEMRKQHTEEHIKEIRWNENEQCLRVYFDNGEWYHYSLAGEWY